MRKQSVLTDYLSTISKHRGSLAIILLASLVASYFLGIHMPKYYKATVFIFVSTNLKPFGLTEQKDPLSTPQVPGRDHLVMTSYLNILRSEALGQRIARRIPGRSAASIQKSTRIKGLAHNSHYKITVRDRDPKIAAEIANAYPAEADNLLREMFLTPMRSTWADLKRRIRETERDLREAQRQLLQLKAKHKIMSPSEEIVQLVKERGSFASQLKESRIRLGELNSEISVVKGQLAHERKMQLTSESMTTNPVINHLKTTLATLQIRIAGALSRYSEEHPEVIRLKREYAQTKKNLKREVDKILGSQTKSINPMYERLREMLATDLVEQKSLQARILGLERNIKDLDENIAKFPELDNKFAYLQRQATSYGNTLKRLKLRFEESKLNEMAGQGTFKVLDKAAAPKKSYFPNPFVNMLIAGPLALCVGILYVIGMAYSGGKGEGEAHHITLLEWQQPESCFIAAKLMSMGLLTPHQVWDILTIQREESGWRFLEIAIKLGYLTGRQVEQIMKTKGLILPPDRNF
jgi:uncharacterized protein involved in exopolysaccharide biosynthesis